MNKLLLQIRQMTFRRKILLYSIVLSLCPVLVMGFLFTVITTNGIQREVNHNQEIVLSQLESEINRYMLSIDAASLRLADDPHILKSLQVGVSVDQLQPSLNMMDVLQKTINASQIQLEASLYYNKYDVLYSTRSGIVREPSDALNDVLDLALQHYDQASFIPPGQSPDPSESLFVRTVPLNSRAPLGYLVLHVKMNSLQRLADQLDPSGIRQLLIISDQGDILAAPPQIMMENGQKDHSSLLASLQDPGKRGVIQMNEHSYHVTVMRSPLHQWYYIALTSSEELARQVSAIRWLTFGIAGILALIWLIIAFLASGRMYRPIQALQSRLADQQLDLNERMLQRMLQGEVSEEEAATYVDTHQLKLKGSYYMVCAVSIDSLSRQAQAEQEYNRRLEQYALRNMVADAVSAFGANELASPGYGQIVAIVGLDSSDGAIEQMRKYIQPVCDQITRMFDFTVSVAISSPRPGYARLFDSYRETSELLQYRWIKGPRLILDPADLQPSLQHSSQTLINWKNEVVDCLKRGLYDEACDKLVLMLDTMPKTLRNADALLGLFTFMLEEIDLYLQSVGYELNDLFEYDVFDYLFELHSLDDVYNWMTTTVFATVRSHIESHSLSHAQTVIPQVLAYIEQNYQTDLSLQHLADHYKISSFVLSRSFKEVVGINYKDYLLHFRMDKAKDWLAHTDMHIKDISEQLRYTSVQNFTRVFKQIVGMPPGKYRSTHMK
ncbi:helix-turn-helix domain-containing protein [Paenibacillus sp. PAMC21692]|uniref:helix-turn-helix domain-containing protein n=1 Tax=Paenibacillus sp. PAMC21692 TaxID=2762320 RepID=UPI00164DBF14|nr:helix-turn-helix domain-containing protein [Paenibacillus sp. PAMC21692]QNK57229.1 AraC family transcriptional regulator [Paenibacillus sp. PAMC21692]